MRIHILLPLLLAAAVPAAAQTASPAPEDQAIVVTGQKDSHEAIANFVHSLTPVDSNGQLSRFEHSVGPVVNALAAPQRAAVEARMRLVAGNIGVTVGGKGCVPNLVLAVTADKRIFIEALRHDRGDYFGDMPTRKIKAMEGSTEPAAAWNIAGPPMSADGRELYWDPAFNTWRNSTTESGSRISVAVHPQFDAAMVVVEKRSLAGVTTTQLADYAILRALTGADPEKLGNSGAPTILHVLEVPVGGTAPITMTSWDYAFLKGFYDARRNLSTSRQRSAIGETIQKQVTAPPHGKD
jgi:hypothetical protein